MLQSVDVPTVCASEMWSLMNSGTPLYICTHSRKFPGRDSSSAPLVRIRFCSVRRDRRDIISTMFTASHDTLHHLGATEAPQPK